MGVGGGTAPKAPSRPALLAVGQALVPTGYARVTHEVLSRLTGRFDVTLFGVNHRGEARSAPFAVRPNRLLGDPLGREQLPAVLDEVGPDVVLLFHDPEFYLVHASALDEYRRRRPGARVVVYLPLEWTDMPAGNLRTLAGADRVVTFTRFGRDLVEAAFRGSGAGAPPLATIPHGLDTTRFRPLVPGDGAGSRRMARDLLFPDRPDLGEAFLVLNANRNNPRKRVELTLAAFAAFARSRPDAFLYLHMGMVDSGIDVLATATDLGVRDRLLLTTESAARPVVSDEHLNLIYNACDAGINTSTGEGWGLVAFEHGATGAAQVLPEHSACLELWEGSALLVPLDPRPEDPWLVSVPAAADALGRLYDDRALLRDLSGRALALARSPHLGWGAVAALWEEVLLATLAGPSRAAAPDVEERPRRG